MTQRTRDGWVYVDDHVPVDESRPVRSLVGIISCMIDYKMGEHSAYPHMDMDLDFLLRMTNPIGHRCLVVGSAGPWYEAMLGTFTRRGCDVWDLGRSEFIEGDYRYINQGVIDYETELYDGVLCISSLEHFGLGRYGDPIDLDGDLKALRTITRRLKIGGWLIIAVPIEEVDTMVGNKHRAYSEQTFINMIEEDYKIEFMAKEPASCQGRHILIHAVKA